MRTILISVVLASALTLGACSSGNSSAHGRVQVVAAEDMWGSIASRIAGKNASVVSIVRNPDADPHDYEPTSQDARTFAGASLVIENGIGYDPWAQQLLDANSGSGRKVLDVGRLLGIPNGGNPHQWYSQASVEQVIEQVAKDLETIDPSHRAVYERNRQTYQSKGLAEYAALIDQIKSRFSGTPIGASESIVSPWAQTLGLKMMTPTGFLTAISEGTEPTANDKATVDAQIRDRDIKVFVFNSQNSTPDVQRLVGAARRERIPVVTVTETLTPENATFEAWQVRELRALLAALESTAKP
jgi:zinc/manganese transport system substrate-binding protein